MQIKNEVILGAGETACASKKYPVFDYTIQNLAHGAPLHGSMHAKDESHLKEILMARWGIQIQFVKISRNAKTLTKRRRNRAVTT